MARQATDADKTYRKTHRKQVLEWKRAYRVRHKTKISASKKILYASNRTIVLAKCKIYRETHREAKLKRDAKWREGHREHCREAHKERHRHKMLTDEIYRLTYTARRRIASVLRGHKRIASAEKMLGCSVDMLRKHLTRLFAPNMSWENRGFGNDKWHIDHIRPCASFDLSDPMQQMICFHYTNLQPLWHLDNLRKGAKYAAI